MCEDLRKHSAVRKMIHVRKMCRVLRIYTEGLRYVYGEICDSVASQEWKIGSQLDIIKMCHKCCHLSKVFSN